MDAKLLALPVFVSALLVIPHTDVMAQPATATLSESLSESLFPEQSSEQSQQAPQQLPQGLAEPLPRIPSPHIHSRTKPHLQQMMDVDDARHLLMRTGFGAEPVAAMHLIGKSRQQGVDLIVQGLSTEPAIAPPEWVNRPLPAYHARPDMSLEDRSAFNTKRAEELEQLRHWWISNMLQSASPQTERLVLFWHDLFATNFFQIGQMSLAMARQNQTFRQLGSGSWTELVKAMIRDPALLRFLNAGSNHKASPNENLARELMELFVLGEGHYDEATVKQAARALTGHNVSLFHNLAFQLNTRAQDRNEKELFGQKGRFDGDALVDILLAQEQAPRFLAARFWYAFVADYPPAEGWLNEQAGQFRQSKLNIKKLYRNVLQSEEFWHDDQRGAIVKSPIDIVIGTARTMNYPIKHWQQMPRWQSLAGMVLFAPPNVSGWNEGAAFITPGRLLNRSRVLRQLTRSPDVSASSVGQQSAEASMMEPDMMQSETPPGGVSQNETMQSKTPPSEVSQNEIMQSKTPLGEMSQNEIMQSDAQKPVLHSPLATQNTDSETMTASALHVQGASKFQPNKTLRMDLVLDNVTTSSNDFKHVRFVLEKKPNSAIELHLSSMTCWPDCINPWPECAWTDPNFAPTKKITLPWIASDHELWNDDHPHQCQFSSLSDTEKGLISTLWASVPMLIEQASNTVKVKHQSERFLPTINAFKSEFQQANVEINNTPYFQHASQLNVDVSFAPVEPALEPLTPPAAQLGGFEELLATFEQSDMHLHQLLMPALPVEGLPELNVAKTRPARDYLNAMLEHPLFQLK